MEGQPGDTVMGESALVELSVQGDGVVDRGGLTALSSWKHHGPPDSGHHTQPVLTHSLLVRLLQPARLDGGMLEGHTPL